MHPFNFFAAVMTVGVALLYLVVNGFHATRGRTPYQHYRTSFCLGVIVLSILLIVRVFAPLPLHNQLLQLAVAAVIVNLIVLIKLFELIAEHPPGAAAKTLVGLLVAVMIAAVVLPDGGLWGEVTFTPEQVRTADIFVRPHLGAASPYYPVAAVGGMLGLGYLFRLAALTRRDRNPSIGRAMMLTTGGMALVLIWNVLCRIGVVDGPYLFSVYGLLSLFGLVWIDRTNEAALARDYERLGEHHFARTALLDALVHHGAFACAEFTAGGEVVTQNASFRNRIAPWLPPADFTVSNRHGAPGQPAVPFWQAFARAREGSVQTETLSWPGADGGPLTYEGRFIPFQPIVGQPHHVIVCLTDITMAIDSRRQIMEAQHLQAIGLLASGVAHEYNNVLTGVIAMGELALREAVNDRQRGHLEIVVQAAKRCTDLSENLLSLSRNRPRQHGPVDLREVIHETFRLVRHTRGVTLDLVESPDARAPIVVEGQRNELATLLLNLLINACDAMDNRGTITVRIDCAARPRAHGSRETAPHVVLGVSDSGPGIPEAIFPHLFEPFFTTKDRGKGSGLGLATAKAIATVHGGTLEAKPTAGRGALFEVSLPLLAGQMAVPAPPEPLPAPPAQHSGAAVVIDDDPTVLATTAIILRDLGYEVRAYASAEAFLAAHPPEARATLKLAVIDIRMPGLDGVQLCGRLLGPGAGLSIILMTGHTEKYDLGKLGQLRHVSILRKPFSLVALQNLIVEIETQSALQRDEPMI